MNKKNKPELVYRLGNKTYRIASFHLSSDGFLYLELPSIGYCLSPIQCNRGCPHSKSC